MSKETSAGSWPVGEPPQGRFRGGKFGGRDRDRTCDLVVANDALSQLSYTPTAANILANTHQRAKPVQLLGLLPVR